MLKNEGYTGAVVSHKVTVNPVTGKTMNRPKDEWIIVPDMHEAIVSKEDFQAVQSMCRDGSNKKKAVKNITYRCGICGRALHKTSANLYCSRKYSAPDSECARVWAKKSKADEAVLGDLKFTLAAFFEEKDKRLREKQEGISSEAEMKKAREELQKLETNKRFLFERLADRSIDRESFKAQKADFDRQIELLKGKINAIMVAMDEEKTPDPDRSALDEEKLTKELWDKYIESAEVFPDDRIAVKFKFS